MGANPVAVVLSRGEVGELVAEHLFEKRGLGELEIGRDADEVSLRVAAAEASGETRAPFDRGSLGELRGFPGIEPLVEGADGERNVIGHGGRLPRRFGVGRRLVPAPSFPDAQESRRGREDNRRLSRLLGLDCFAQLGDTVGPGVQGSAIPPGEIVELAVDVNLGLLVEGVTQAWEYYGLP